MEIVLRAAAWFDFAPRLLNIAAFQHISSRGHPCHCRNSKNVIKRAINLQTCAMYYFFMRWFLHSSPDSTFSPVNIRQGCITTLILKACFSRYIRRTSRNGLCHLLCLKRWQNLSLWQSCYSACVVHNVLGFPGRYPVLRMACHSINNVLKQSVHRKPGFRLQTWRLVNATSVNVTSAPTVHARLYGFKIIQLLICVRATL